MGASDLIDSGYPRVLVISNNCFSRSGSNGRTMAVLFESWPASQLAQFYLKSETPDSSVGARYFRVTDLQALRSVFWRSGPAGGPVSPISQSDAANVATTGSRGIKKTPLTALIRNAAWSVGAWESNGFTEWVDEFDPDVVVLQAGDSAFMYATATRLARRFSIPLVIYNSEDYYFKDTNFMSQHRNWVSDGVYSLFRRSLQRQTAEAMAYASLSVYITDALRATYSDCFGSPTMTAMTVASISPLMKEELAGVPVVSYVGNLGLGRYESLMEIGEALHHIDPRFHLDVYGRAPSPNIMHMLERASGVRFMGFIPYERTLDVIGASDLLVHAESFASYYRKDLRHAFSTKIADSLASGVCFVLYAPRELSCSQYLIAEESACVVTKKSDLENTLRCLLDSAELRKAYVERALKTAARNHSFEGSTVKFQEALRRVVGQSLDLVPRAVSPASRDRSR